MISFLLFLTLTFLHWRCTVAFPLDADNGGLDLTIPKIIEGVVDGVENTVDFFKDLSIPSPESSTLKTPLDIPDSSSPLEEPADSPGPIIDANPTSAKNCDPGKDKDCEKVTAMNVFAKDCSDKIHNDVLTDELNQMVRGPNGVYITEDKSCGVVFWTVHLTPTQVKEIETRSAVRGIAIDKAVPSNQFSSNDDLGEDKSAKSEKRDEIVSRANDGRDLAFFSTPPFKYLEEKFTYFSSAGQGVTVYLMGFGADRFHFELTRIIPTSGEKFSKRSIINYWLYAKDALVREIDEDGSGSCMLSKIAGRYLGLASNANIVIVKIVLTQSSILNGLWQIVNHLIYRRSQGEETEGYSVFAFPQAWPDDGTENEAALKAVLSLLLKEYKVVVVAPAGYSDQDSNEINTVPAKFSTELPIITVGAVSPYDGGRYPWSPRGLSLTVSAPGLVQCAAISKGSMGRGVKRARGTNVAAASVAGMVAGMLAIPDLGGKLRGSYDIPKAVRDWVMTKSWVRPGATVNSVWNGITPGHPELWDP